VFWHSDISETGSENVTIFCHTVAETDIRCMASLSRFWPKFKLLCFGLSRQHWDWLRKQGSRIPGPDARISAQNACRSKSWHKPDLQLRLLYWRADGSIFVAAEWWDFWSVSQWVLFKNRGIVVVDDLLCRCTVRGCRHGRMCLIVLQRACDHRSASIHVSSVSVSACLYKYWLAAWEPVDSAGYIYTSNT